jgi:hypothetical protein
VVASDTPEEEIMRVTWTWIHAALCLGICGWLLWLTFRGGDWHEIALSVVWVVAVTGLGLRKIWGKYLIYLLAVTGVLWVAHHIWLEIVTGQWFIQKQGLAEEIGAPLTTILGLTSLAAILFLCIGGSYVVHCMYKNVERDHHAEEPADDSSSPPSHSSDTHSR